MRIDNKNLKLFRDIPFIHLSDKTARDFVIATGADEEFYNASLANLANVQNYLPEKQVYYYDMGLDEDQRKSVSIENYYQFVDNTMHDADLK